MQSAPKPRDPRQLTVTAEEITSQVDTILAEDAATLQEEVDLLTRAHAVLNEALQRGA